MEKTGPPTISHRRSRLHGRVPLLGLVLFGIILLQFLYLPSQLAGREISHHQRALSNHHLKILDEGLSKCASDRLPPTHYAVPPSPQRTNPRWNSKTGQSNPLMITNATLFDGTTFLTEPVNILLTRGIITYVAPTSSSHGADAVPADTTLLDASGHHVTPGLVDMHSHHMAGTWPALTSTTEADEINPSTGPLTPMVRVLDSMKAYDAATVLIASGGVTSSLILPGSANIMGGEAYPVKNLLRAGAEGEEVVEELLLEYGVEKAERRRYMKMACGENPSRVYDHVRMGNAWIFREQMAKAQDLRARQDS